MLFRIINLEYKLENLKILSDQNFSIKEGNHLLILCPSGSGKTTLINLMAGLIKPSNGNIFFKEKNYSSLSETESDDLRSKNFGFIFQKLHLIGHLNIIQNIKLAQNSSDSLNTLELIEGLGLIEKKKERVSDLSLGEAQRVAIARGVANNPKVIFADEPTSSLDDGNAKNVMDLIFSQTRKTNSTLIVSTHDERIKKHFSNVLELST